MVEGDDRAFEIWHEREDSVRKYLLQARTVNIKNSWVKEICGIQQRISQPVWSEYGLLGIGSLIGEGDFFSRTKETIEGHLPPPQLNEGWRLPTG